MRADPSGDPSVACTGDSFGGGGVDSVGGGFASTSEVSSACASARPPEVLHDFEVAMRAGEQRANDCGRSMLSLMSGGSEGCSAGGAGDGAEGGGDFGGGGARGGGTLHDKP